MTYSKVLVLLQKECSGVDNQEIANPDILAMQDEINQLKETVKTLTDSHNKMFKYLKDSNTQGNKESTKVNKTLKEFINEKESKK